MFVCRVGAGLVRGRAQSLKGMTGGIFLFLASPSPSPSPSPPPALIWSLVCPPPRSACPPSPVSRWVGTVGAGSRRWGRFPSCASRWPPPAGRPFCGAAWGRPRPWWASGCSLLCSARRPSLPGTGAEQSHMLGLFRMTGGITIWKRCSLKEDLLESLLRMRKMIDMRWMFVFIQNCSVSPLTLLLHSSSSSVQYFTSSACVVIPLIRMGPALV